MAGCIHGLSERFQLPGVRRVLVKNGATRGHSHSSTFPSESLRVAFWSPWLRFFLDEYFLAEQLTGVTKLDSAFLPGIG